MARIPYISRKELTTDGQEIYDHIAESRSNVAKNEEIPRVFQLLLNSPKAASALGKLGEYLRFESSLDPVIREIAILSVARQLGSRYEWAHHDAHTRPSPRIEQGITLAKKGVSAAIDVSDGLVSDLERMCIASGVGAVVFADKVPIDGFLREAYPKEAMGLALGGGEDYELLFTAPRNLMDQVVFALDMPVSIIGEIVDSSFNVKVQDNEGRVLDVKNVGWDHFE